MRQAVLGARGGQVDHALVEADLGPAQASNLLTPLPGEDQQLDDAGIGVPESISRQPYFAQLLVIEHSIPGLLPGRTFDPDARVGGDEFLTPRPIEQPVENGVQPIRHNWRAGADPVEHGNDVGVGDLGEATAAPAVGEREPAAATPLILAPVLRNEQRRTFLRRDRDLGVHREPEQSRGPLPGAVMAELIFGDVAPSDRLKAIVDFGLAASSHHLVTVRVGTALDFCAQRGSCRARVLQADHRIGADRVLDRLAVALAPVAQRPRLHAARLDDEVQAVAIEHFLPRGGWFPGLDVQASEFHQYRFRVATGGADTPVKPRYPDRITQPNEALQDNHYCEEGD